MPKFLPGNTIAQKGEAKRLPWYGTIAPVTMVLIKRWAKELDRSESQIIDDAIAAFHPPQAGAEGEGDEMSVSDVIKQGSVISNGERWMKFENERWVVRELKAGTTHEQWVTQKGATILYAGPDENEACLAMVTK